MVVYAPIHARAHILNCAVRATRESQSEAWASACQMGSDDERVYDGDDRGDRILR